MLIKLDKHLNDKYRRARKLVAEHINVLNVIGLLVTPVTVLYGTWVLVLFIPILLILLLLWLGRSRDLLSPYILFPAAYSCYYLLGSLNISYYRGYIGSDFYNDFFLGLLAYYIGVALTVQLSKYLRPIRGDFKRRTWRGSRVMFAVSIMCAAGLNAYILILFRYGIPLIQAFDRFKISTYYLYMAEWPVYGLFLRMMYVLKSEDRLSVPIAFAMFIGLSLLALLGWRSPIIVLVLVFGTAWYYIKGISFRLIFQLALLVYVVVSGVWFIRRQITGEAAPIAYLLRTTGYPKHLWPFMPWYFVAREGTALFYRLKLMGVNNLGGQLLILDTLSILPGKQITGGILLAQILGGTGAAGLTPSILGGLYADFGRLGIVVGLAVIGIILQLHHQRVVQRGSLYDIIAYAYVISFSLHYLHRGVFKPIYLMHYGILVIFNILVREEERTSRAEQ